VFYKTKDLWMLGPFGGEDRHLYESAGRIAPAGEPSMTEKELK
jgi:hypothetical protein